MTRPPDVAACSACLATEGLHLIGSRTKEAFLDMTGFLLCAQNPQYVFVCAICNAQLAKWRKFRDRCERARQLLAKLADDGEITAAKISSIDRSYHKLTLNLTQSVVHTLDINENQQTVLETSVKYEKDEEINTFAYSSYFMHVDTDLDDCNISNDDPENTKENKVEGCSETTPIKSANNKTGNTEVFQSAVYTLNLNKNQQTLQKTPVKCENDEDVNTFIDSPRYIPVDIDLDDSTFTISTNSNTGNTEVLHSNCKRKRIDGKLENTEENKVEACSETTFTKSTNSNTGNTEVLHSNCKRKRIDGKLENTEENKVEACSETTFTKSTNNNTGNTEVFHSKCKRKRDGGRLENIKENKVEGCSQTISTKNNAGNTKVLGSKCKRKKIRKLENTKENNIEGSSETTTKSTNINTGNTKVLSSRCKRKRIGDDFYPDIDYEKFEEEFDVKIKLFSKEEQRQELEDRRSSKKYLTCPFKCESCGKGFNFEKTLRNHLSYHDPSFGPFECDLCHVRFRTNRKRLSHGDNTHRLRFTCNKCGYATGTRQLARIHHAQHNGETYPCKHCEAVFQRPTSFFSHLRIHHPTESRHFCQICGETFASERGVYSHQARAHRLNVKPEEFKCPTCDIKFSSSEALAKHTDSGAAHSAWPCAECGEGCDGEETLKAHVESHKDHRREQCDMSFNTATALDTHHARKHLNVRPYGTQNPPTRARAPSGPLGPVVCDICGRLVQHASLMKCHQLTHQAVKPFACEHCPKTFNTKYTRDFHTRTHTGEQPFQCAHCSRSFSHQGNLKRHCRVVHEGIRDRFQCHLCGAVLSTSAGVRVHVDTVHRRLPPPKRRVRRRTKKPT